MSGYSYADLKAEGSRSEGRTYYYTGSIGAGATVNITLDSVFLQSYNFVRVLTLHSQPGTLQFFRSNDSDGTFVAYGSSIAVNGGVVTIETTDALAGSRYLQIRLVNAGTADTYQTYLMLLNKKV